MSDQSILQAIHAPGDVKRLDRPSLDRLCGELRERIITTVADNGGHLSSNLGTVELTVALLRAFDLPRDQVVFDVGHQCYAYKLLTGRAADFHTLRQSGGISGFTNRTESEYDLFTTGHASNAISLAVGLTRARQLQGGQGHTVAVLGDGALTGGMSYEALNDAGSSRVPLIVILNDNGMSISGNVGALSGYLTRLRLSKGWLGVKKTISEGLLRLPAVGKPLHAFFESAKDHIRNIFIHDKFFASLGFRYLGPIDGHSIAGMERVFRRAAALNEPVLIHVVTRKGQGYAPAENSPDVYHGVAPFYVDSGEAKRQEGPEYGRTAALYLAELQRGRGDLCMVTAAMRDGTGAAAFAEAHPGRLFDVGIAEEHAVSLCAGLARGGLRPVCAIYDTFLQRAYDQMLTDVCMQGLPVLFLLDRAGLNGADGASHHGIFGLSYLLSMPGMRIFMPLSETQLRGAIDGALAGDGPTAICYPRRLPKDGPMTRAPEDDGLVCYGDRGDAALVCAGVIAQEALKAAERLAGEGIRLTVLALTRVRPVPPALWTRLGDRSWVTLEENVQSGGLGEMLCAEAVRTGHTPPAACFAIPDGFPTHGDRSGLLKTAGLDADTLADRIRALLKGERA